MEEEEEEAPVLRKPASAKAKALRVSRWMLLAFGVRCLILLWCSILLVFSTVVFFCFFFFFSPPFGLGVYSWLIVDLFAYVLFSVGVFCLVSGCFALPCDFFKIVFGHIS